MPESRPEKLIALTGATGFVGSWILETALSKGYRVKALTRRPVPEMPNVEWVKGDLENLEALAELLEGSDAFIHTAGLVKARSEDHFFAVNERAVATLADLALKADTSKDFHFVLVSSLAARHPELSPYAKSKRGGEEALKKFDVGQTIVRPPAVYGPGDKEILKLFKAMKKGFAPVAGDDDNRFSLIHVGDVAAAIVDCLHHKSVYSQTLEPDDGKAGGYTIKDVAAVAGTVLGRKVRTVEIPETVLHLFAGANEMFAKFSAEPAILSRHKVKEMTHPNWVSDTKTLEHLPHWDPEFPLEKGFQDTISWYREKDLL